MSQSAASSAFRLENLSDRFGAKIWSVTFDLPGEKVNKFSRQAIDEFRELLPKLEKLHSDGQIEALVVLSGKPGIFIAGADIEMIRAAKTEEEARELSRSGQKMVDAWEDLPFPTVVAIQGAALGGGCELSLASTAIVMSQDPAARIGLPEVQLGFVPGMGGCVRLPRKVGLATALDMILTGKTLTGERAAKAGLAEVCLPAPAFHEAALRWTEANLASLKAGKRLAKEPKLGGMGGPMGTALERTPMGRGVMFKKAREGVMSKTRGKYPAALEAIEVLRDTGGAFGDRILGQARTEAMEREAHGFGKCAATAVSKNLIRVFFLTEAVKKSKGVNRDDIKPKSVRSGGVLGAGVMGGGIAHLMADKGIQARMKDLGAPALETGIKQATRLFSKDVQKRKITMRQAQQKLNLIAPVMDYSGFRSVELVVEAIVEKMDVKKKVLAELEQQVSAGCVIASNTSSLSITEMQSALSRPQNFGGMHFFNPVAKMPLVEVIRGEKTSDETVAAIFNLSKQMGKMPIVVKDSPGFLVNRLLMPYLNEATWLVADGVPIERLDEVILDFGMPMGPMELIDEVGVDVGDKVAHILHSAFGARMEPAPANGKVVAAGRLGKKNGKGIYEYDAQGRHKTLNPEIYTILGIQPSGQGITDEEIVDRCILPMINEAARCLEDQVVATADDVDLGMIMGTGFPPFHGGLLRYADSVGAKVLVEKLRKYQQKFGARYEPAALLLKLAESGKTFHSA